MKNRAISTLIPVAAISTLVVACAGGSSPYESNELPAGVAVQSITTFTAKDVTLSNSPSTQDLLTGGLGKTGIAAATAPPFADPLNPTVAELRRGAIYTAHHLSNTSAANGYGTLFGPNVDAEGRIDTTEGLIPGKEYIAYSDDGTGRKNVVLMVQIPSGFNVENPCIVAAVPPGSFGIYGAVGMAGEWALKHGCAAAYTDAGKGVGFHDLAADRVNKIDGQLIPRLGAGSLAHFAVDLTGAALANFNSAFPNRVAIKHFFSQQNPQADWGANILDSIRFAYWAINEEHAPVDPATGRHLRAFSPMNTKVIATGYSNGGGASLQAAEQDAGGLISGVVAAIPNAQPRSMAGLGINFGGAPVANAGKSFVDYYSYRAIYAPCAAISSKAQAPSGVRPGWLGAGTAPTGTPATQVGGKELHTVSANRCQSLADRGLVQGATSAEQADAALAKMQAYGFADPVAAALLAFNYRFLDVISAYGYIAAAGRFSVADNLCGLSLAGTDATGSVAAQPASERLLFGQAASTYDVVYNDSLGGARNALIGISPSTGRMDGAFDAALCLRSLATGTDTVTGAPLLGGARLASQRVQAGSNETLLGGDLRNKPAIILGGRSDVATPPDHAARAYLALNSRVEGGASNLSYYEITNAQHLDGLPIAGFDTLFVPLPYYFNNSLDIMWNRLNGKAPLPPSQVVRTVPRGGSPGAAPAVVPSQVPLVSAAPRTGDLIAVKNGTVSIAQ